MHLNGIDLNLLVALDALLTERSVTRAASRLCVTQPAMSVALAKLRTQFGDQLLERIGRQMELTPFAVQLEPAVRELLHDIRSLLYRRSEFDPGVDSRDFSLVMSSSVAEIFGVPALRALREVAPQVRCQIDIFVGPDLIQRLLDGKVDLCIQLFEPGLWAFATDDDALLTEPLFNDHYVIIADRSNASVRDGMSYQDFCAIEHVETRFGGDLKSPVERTLSTMECKPPTALRVSTYALALDAVLGTSMTAIVPNRVARMSSHHSEISVIEPPFELPALNHKLIWHRRNEHDPAHRWLREFLSEFSRSAQFHRSELGDAA